MTSEILGQNSCRRPGILLSRHCTHCPRRPTVPSSRRPPSTAVGQSSTVTNGGRCLMYPFRSFRNGSTPSCAESLKTDIFFCSLRLHVGYGDDNVAMQRGRFVLLPSHREAEIRTQSCHDHARHLDGELFVLKRHDNLESCAGGGWVDLQ